MGRAKSVAICARRFDLALTQSPSPDGQGCDGGFGYLVAKWAQDFTISAETCFPYESGLSNSQGPACAKRCSNASQHYRATQIGYVGGYFGNCSEVGMMRELQRGPVAVGIAVPGSFERYTGGIYTELPAERTARLQGKCGAGDITACGVGHAVLVVG
eukprot:SAG11_NODE_2595_length_3185_cov_8.000324_4_plen_158_part_00